MSITIAREQSISVEEFRAVLHRSTLAERRPVDDLERVQAMLDGSDLIITARDETGLLVGIARSVTDFAYCCYLSDLAVDTACQAAGIGQGLIRETQKYIGAATLYLVSAPGAVTYYEHIGMERVPACFRFKGA
ncbi:N-acetyltransferase [Kordiimonas sediminis]|uniref:N-acetyltransferase n=1 Tax=Kordiimonas sediminis TaxID=1735581 RepID=A0A919AHY1_9PROT|nr:GNAT family N-acetyltransferase [Kordiimonas sediminis]GHF10624.1 N-acetyltransferase [Kordiimonas sediminis]